VSRDAVGAKEALMVTARVRNAGKRDGDEVVQLYARAVNPKRPMPLKELRGFTRVTLKPGEQREVRFEVRPEEAMAYYDEARKTMAVEPGEYELQVGASSRDIRLTGRITVK
jgi:beta-glucosidase